MDKIADMLTKIRNAGVRKIPAVDVAKNNLIEDVLKILKKEGYIFDYTQCKDSQYKFTVTLKYHNGRHVIAGLRRTSHLSRRVYVTKETIPSVYNNMGVAVLTTSKGVLTDKEARAIGVGGEVICTVW